MNVGTTGIKLKQPAFVQRSKNQVLRRLAIIWLFLFGISLCQEAKSQNRFKYEGATIRDVIKDIEITSAYRFLYRDALITGKPVSFHCTSEELLSRLSEAILDYDLQLEIDTVRKQVLLTRLPERESRRETVLSGYVIDDESGIRLPYATLSWSEDDHFRGVAANDAGAFQIHPSPNLLEQGYIEITASYVGYRSRNVSFDLVHSISDLAIRLTPQTIFGQEVIVTSTALVAELDTTWFHLIQPGLFSPLGESSVIRSLQTLPSVSFSPALAQGLNVRGSTSDGFQVLLDGITIYNQNHFFGLFDAFNEDALQRVGFFYGIAPADFPAPPGGTLSFVTRTGSQTGFKQTVGLSNTAIKTTLEGPLGLGRGSWLISGRHSYLNAIDWFNNSALIAKGLNVIRETSLVARPPNVAGQRGLFPGRASARFYDLHGKLYFENEDGRRLTINGYIGGDRTSHGAERLMPLRAGQDSTGLLVRRPVQTRNRWGNEAASIQDQRSLKNGAYAHTLFAVSSYRSSYSKDDFVYQRPVSPGPGAGNGRNSGNGQNTGQQPGQGIPADSLLKSTFLDSFANDNDLLEIKLYQRFDVTPSFPGLWSAGYSIQRYNFFYSEESAGHENFSQTRKSTQIDFFAQYDLSESSAYTLQAGLRSHYYSNGAYLRLSPRLRIRLFPQSPLSIGLGASRNHQFLHRLYLEHATSTDIWTLSTVDEAPGSVDHYTAGLYARLPGSTFLQVEGYYKSYINLRLHEIQAAHRPIEPSSLFLAPWLHDNKANGKGLEVMLRARLGDLLWTNSYTLAEMKIQNVRINRGQPFYAQWDRKHQFSSHLEGSFNNGLSWHLSWYFATGIPNALYGSHPSEPKRLADYHRMDISIQYQYEFQGITIKSKASMFNLYDRQNPWYRTPLPVVDTRQAPRTLQFTNVDVYDLGFQPSFELSFTF